MKPTKFMFFPVVMLCLTTLAGGVAAKELIITQGNNLMEVIDTETDDIVASIPVDGFVRDVVWSDDKKTMYATTRRRAIVKIDLEQTKVVKTYDAGVDGWKRMIWGFVLCNDHKTAYINSIDRKVEGGEVLVRPTISQINLEDGKVLRSMTPPWGVSALLYQKNDKTLFAVGLDIYKIDISQSEMKIVDTYPMLDKKKNMLAVWPNIRENGDIFMANYYTPEYMGLLAIDANTGEILDRRINGPPVMAYSFIYSPDKKKAYGMMEDVTVIDLESNNVIKSFPNAEGTSFSLIPSGDGKKLYAGAGGSVMTVYDAATMNVLKVLQLQSDSVSLNRITF
jgi:DNA-binding beta-propeller fold protein YncE